MGFEVDGVEVKVRQDVGAKSIDWRGSGARPPERRAPSDHRGLP